MNHRFLLPFVALALGACASSNSMNPGLSHGATMSFKAEHRFTVTVPDGAQRVRVWCAMPSRQDPDQTVSSWKVESPYPTRIATDNWGNEFLFVEADNPKAGTFDIVTTFDIARSEVRADLDPAKTRAHTEAEKKELAKYLEGSSQSVIDANARAMARDAVGDETNPILASRRIYDAILERIEYHVKDPKPDCAKTMNSTGTGSSAKCYETCTGNCTDFHSLYAAVSRAAGIPTRAVYGSFFKGPLDGVDKDQSYHCWIEFHAPNVGWVPLDVAVADVFVDSFQANENSRPRAHLTVADGYHGPDAKLVDYYFGNIEARRVVWHRNRDLVLDPRQAGAPLLWLPKAYVEVDGKPGSAGRKLTYSSK